MRFADFVQKLKLLLSIINLLLLDATVDDTVQRGEETFIVLSGFREGCDGRVVVS